MLGRSSLLGLAVIGALSSMGGHAVNIGRQAIEIVRPQSPASGRKGKIRAKHHGHGLKKIGMTCAQQKRASNKSRNIKRHKASCRK